MKNDDFWLIVAATYDKNLDRREELLFERLKTFEENQILAFDSIAFEVHDLLSTWPLFGVYYRWSGRKSPRAFSDFRFWLLYCGESAFRAGRDDPDSLVTLIDQHEDVGCDGIRDVPLDALAEKNSEWLDGWPPHRFDRGEQIAGHPWENDQELKVQLPRTYERFVENATPEEEYWRNTTHEQLVKDFGIKVRLRELIDPSAENPATQPDHRHHDETEQE